MTNVLLTDAAAAVLAVVVPAHNPNRERLRRVLAGLEQQSLPRRAWQLVLVDNASNPPIDATAVAWHPHGRVVRERVLGLTAARRCGVASTRAPLIVFVDDDNVLAPDYLENVHRRFAAHAQVGAMGGRSIPEFESSPKPWQEEFFGLLAIRDLGPQPLLARGLREPGAGENRYPACSPIGAGMAVRREAVATWTPDAALPDRQGARLSSAGDNELVFAILAGGWEVAYFPELVLTHLIPAARLQPAYLARLNRGIQSSWMQVLRRYDANPWPVLSRRSARLRQLKAWVTYGAWRSAAAWVRWQGACGHYEGRVQTANG